MPSSPTSSSTTSVTPNPNWWTRSSAAAASEESTTPAAAWPARTSQSKVRELTAILDGDGYLAEAVAEPDGSFLIVEHNCAILGIALRYGQACGTELDFIRTVLPEARSRESPTWSKGATNCSYRIRPEMSGGAWCVGND